MSKVKVVSNGIDSYVSVVPDVEGFSIPLDLYNEYEQRRLAFDEIVADIEEALNEARTVWIDSIKAEHKRLGLGDTNA